jgi:hypothetical protein
MEYEVKEVGANTNTELIQNLKLNLSNELLAKNTANTALTEVRNSY